MAAHFTATAPAAMSDTAETASARVITAVDYLPVLGLGFPEGAGLGVPAEELEDAMLLEPLEAGVLLLEVEDALLLELPLGETELSSFLSEAT